ncbi:hypothetical protein QQF64_000006 [Cirrhinus molitorella]|uniref:Uncharacterized protein n=1 Tax=Cirrhinus molitorella TaxID=172907 RepID=A0ABR3NW14_9TELE
MSRKHGRISHESLHEKSSATAHLRAPLSGEVEFGADVRHFVERDFYIDDGLNSLPSIKEAIDLLKTTKDMLASSNLRLHKIASNCPAVMHAFSPADYAKDLKHLNLDTDSPPLQRSLGLIWDLQNDAFSFHVNLSDKSSMHRGVLVTVNSLFDPPAMVAPITIQGKLLLRELSNTQSDWDAPLDRNGGKMEPLDRLIAEQTQNSLEPN